MKDREFLKKLAKLTIPATIQALMLSLVAVSDALMLGSIEQDIMAAVTLATQVQFIQNMILASATSAAAILGAQYYGKGDRNTMVRILQISLKLCMAISLITFLLCEFCPGLLMDLFTNDPYLKEIGISYLKISAFSYLLTGASQSFLTINKVSGHTRTTAIVSSSAVVINIFLNALLIFGLIQIPVLGIAIKPLGVQGAALATAITRCIELIVCILLAFQKNYLNINPKTFLKFEGLLFGDYVKVMMPLLGACLFWGVGFTSYTSFMGHLGKDTAAANSVAAVSRDLICCITDGMAIGGGILIGNELGAGRLDLGRKYGDRLVVISFLIGIASTILILLMTPILLMFVSLTPAATRILIGFMLVLSVYMIGRAVNTIVINGIFSAGGDTLYDLYSLAVCMWGLAVPLAALGTFAFGFAPVVVYACSCLDEVGKIPWTLLHYKRYKWLKDLTRNQEEA